MSDDELQLIATTTHGRVLIRGARAAAARGVLVGFHGYMENAAIRWPGWRQSRARRRGRSCSVQALHRFYRGRSDVVVASWMTREDRESAIADNVEYDRERAPVRSSRRRYPHRLRRVLSGCADGVQGGSLGRSRAAGVIAIGGDVPPELLGDAALRFPPVLMARGERDDWLTLSKFEARRAALTTRGALCGRWCSTGPTNGTMRSPPRQGKFLNLLA